MRIGLSVVAVVALGSAMLALLGVAAIGGPVGPTAPPSAVPQAVSRLASVERLPSGGPFIGERVALQKAASFAQGDIVRQEIHILSYASVGIFEVRRSQV